MKLTMRQIEVIKKDQLDRIKELNKKIKSDKKLLKSMYLYDGDLIDRVTIKLFNSPAAHRNRGTTYISIERGEFDGATMLAQKIYDLTAAHLHNSIKAHEEKIKRIEKEQEEFLEIVNKNDTDKLKTYL